MPLASKSVSASASSSSSSTSLAALWLLVQLLLLSFVAHMALANPVSSPEIASKSTVVNSASVQQQPSAKSNAHPHTHPHPHPQDAQLNSLTVYATNYDTIANMNAHPSVNFKPSYKIPDMETNFTPIQATGPAHAPMAGPTPVLMQYLPQGMHDGGVQYLQLIPTRPLIVPISPYLTGVSAPHPSAVAAANSHPPLAPNAHPEYTPRMTSMLSALPPNAVQPPMSSALLELPAGGLPYGLHTYANSIQPYRSGYRINREIKDKHLPGSISLNLNEYMPGAHDSPHAAFFRGRP